MKQPRYRFSTPVWSAWPGFESPLRGAFYAVAGRSFLPPWLGVVPARHEDCSCACSPTEKAICGILRRSAFSSTAGATSTYQKQSSPAYHLRVILSRARYARYYLLPHAHFFEKTFCIPFSSVIKSLPWNQIFRTVEHWLIIPPRTARETLNSSIVNRQS